MQKVSLNTEKIHIGDGKEKPLPVGTSWKTEFTLTGLPKWAAVSVEASDNTYADPVVVNDATLGALRTSPSGAWTASVFPVPIERLRSGANTLEIRSMPKSDNYDDFFVRAVILSLGDTDPPAVRTVSRASARAGAMIVVSGARFDPADGEVILGDDPVPAFITSPGQAIFQAPKGWAPGTYPLVISAGGARSDAVDFTLLPGDPVYEPLPLADGAAACPDAGLPGDVAPRPGAGGRPYGDGILNLSDVVRLLRRVVGLEPDPWP